MLNLATLIPLPSFIQEEGGFVLDRLFGMTEAGAFHLFDLGVGLVLASLLTFALVQSYRVTHRGATYSVAFLQSLFILTVCTTLIMVVIGSNIARAFSLVGALSIVRFRTAIKDPRDVGFVFAALAIGMACGTGFYAAALLFTLFLCVLLLILGKLNVGASVSTNAVVRVTVDSESGASAVPDCEAVLRTENTEPVIVNRVADRDAGEETVSWRVRTGESEAQARLQMALRELAGVRAVAVYALDDFHVL